MSPLERRCRSLLRAYPAWYRRERAGEMLGTLLEASPPDARWPSFRDVRALVIGGVRVRGWTWLLSMAWVVIGAGGAIYATVAFSHPGYGEGLLIPPNVQWPGEPQVVIDVGVIAEVAWVLLAVPLLLAGFVRLRGWRRGSPRRRVDSHVVPRELQADRIAVDADHRCACGCQRDRVSANAAALVGDNPGALRAAGWAGSWLVGLALMNQTANFASSGLGSAHAVLSLGEMAICAAWLALGGAMTWILATPAPPRAPKLPATTISGR